MLYNLKKEIYAKLIEVDGKLGYYYGRNNDKFRVVAKVGECCQLYTVLNCMMSAGINSYVEVYITSNNYVYDSYNHGGHSNGMLKHTPDNQWRKISNPYI